MVRPRTYDPKQVRDSVMRAFHVRGYDATSMSDLEAATGLDRRQIYDGFGNKQKLFACAVDDFIAASAATFLYGLEHGPARLATIEAALTALAESVDSAEGRLGCMVCNAAREPIAETPAISKRVNAFFDRIRAAYARALIGAEQSKELPTGADITALSAFLLGAHVSICVLAKAGRSAEETSAVARHALDRLRLST